MLLSILLERKRYVDAIVITGGEPTIQPDLPEFLAKLKENGFNVKLDTNGLLPDVLRACLPYLDYVAINRAGIQLADLVWIHAVHQRDAKDGVAGFDDVDDCTVWAARGCGARCRG